MVPQRILRITLCCLLVLLSIGATAPGVAAPPPRPLCDACGDSFEATAESHGVTLTVERSTATVTVFGNGTATWIVRNHLADSEGASRLRTNASLRAAIADRAMWDTELLGSNVSSDGVVTIRYREAEFAERSIGGALHSGEFTERYGYRNMDGLGADRLVVVAPDGMRVGWTVPGATVSDDGQRMTLTRLDEGGFVTFVPHDATLGPLLSLLATGSLIGPLTAVNALAYVAVPTVVFALLVGASGILLSKDHWAVQRIRNAGGVGLAIVGLLVVFLSLFGAGGVSLLGGAAAPLFGVGIALVLLGVGLSRQAVREQATYRRLLLGAVLGAFVAASSTVAGALVFEQNGLTLSLLSSVALGTPVFVLLPAGFAFGRHKHRLALGTAAVGFALATLPLTLFTPPPFGLGLLLVLATPLYASLLFILGVPLLVVGRSVAMGSSIADAKTAQRRN